MKDPGRVALGFAIFEIDNQVRLISHKTFLTLYLGFNEKDANAVIDELLELEKKGIFKWS